MNERAIKIQALRWMKNTLRFDFESYDDCGEVNCTKLAEDCAEALNLYEDDVDFEIPEVVFDAAVDVSRSFEKKSA